jgi:hypothetical protein
MSGRGRKESGVMSDESWKVGDRPEYKGAVYRIAAMDAFGFCLLKDSVGSIAFTHADSRDFTENLVTIADRVFKLNSK